MKCVYQLRKSHIDFYFNANYGSLCCVVYINIVQQLQVVYFVSLHRVCAVDRDNLRLYYDEMTMMMMMMMACSENVQSVRIWSNPLTCYFSVFILIMGTARHDMPPRRLVNLCYDIWKCKKKKKYDRDEPRIAMTNTRLDCPKNIYIYIPFSGEFKNYLIICGMDERLFYFLRDLDLYRNSIRFGSGLFVLT